MQRMVENCIPNARWMVAFTLAVALVAGNDMRLLLAQGRYATSDSGSGYVHWIELLDANNTKIDPTAEFPQPYSPARTCGRCHEFDTIAHGWHFNATDPSVDPGRPGQPWIWSDPRSGTHLPLSYRGWEGTYNPDVLGLSRWEVAAKLGGFLPGGSLDGGTKTGAAASDTGAGPAERESASADEATAQSDRSSRAEDSDEDSNNSDEASNNADRDRTAITGEMPIDCLLCHGRQGSGYSSFVWTEQIAKQNFVYAPTVALGLAEINGSLARLKSFDPTAEDAASKLPKLTYDTSRFRSDGTVFFDLVRKPQDNACNYCHTNVSAESIAGTRWMHDDDVHTRAGLQCADCHRNGLDHHTVRAFEGEQHVGGALMASLSCQGCHMGDPVSGADPLAQPGRMGAPKPAHRGLPPLHFEKLSCTACHSGSLPEQNVPRQVNSIIHRLGEHVKRTGDELPAVFGPVNLPSSDSAHELAERQGKYTPHRMFWPSFWGTIQDGKVEPLNPEVAFDLVRKPLKVRRDFTSELNEVSLSLSQRREILGEDRARVKDDARTAEERDKVQAAEKVARDEQIDERMRGALLAIEEQFPGKQAVFITGGTGWVRYGDEKLKMLSGEDLGQAAEPYAWPMAHNVRPARQALGATGCTECHSEQSPFFFADIQPLGLVPDQDIASVKVHSLQHADLERLKNWNQVFAGRASFKIASLIALAATCLITLSVLAWNIGVCWSSGWQRKPN